MPAVKPAEAPVKAPDPAPDSQIGAKETAPASEPDLMSEVYAELGVAAPAAEDPDSQKTKAEPAPTAKPEPDDAEPVKRGEDSGEGDSDDEDEADSPGDKTPEDADSDTGSEDDDADETEDDQDGKSKDELPAWVQPRIDKLTRQKNELKEELGEVQGQLSAAKEAVEQARRESVVLRPTQQSPLSDLMSVADVQERMSVAQKVRDWCLSNPDGGVVAGAQAGEEVEIDAADVARRKAFAEDVLHRHGPQRLEFLKSLAVHEAAARKVYPDLYKDGTEDARIASALLRDLPGLLNLPDYGLIVGDFLVGARVRNGQYRLVKVTKGKEPPAVADATQPAKPAPVPKAPASPRPSAPPRKPAAGVASDSAYRRAIETGEQEDLAAFAETLVV